MSAVGGVWEKELRKRFREGTLEQRRGVKRIRICKVKGGDVSKMLSFESAVHFCIKPFRVSTCLNISTKFRVSLQTNS